jgi:hypothetical protein
MCEIFFKFFKNHKEGFLLKLFSPMLMDCSTMVESFDNFSWYKVPLKNLSTEICFLCVTYFYAREKRAWRWLPWRSLDLQENFSWLCWDPKQRTWIRMSWYFRWVLFFFCQLISHPSSLYVVDEISGWHIHYRPEGSELQVSVSQVHPHLLAVDLRGHKITKMKPSKCLFFGFNQWMGSVPVCFTVPNFSSILQGSRSLKSMGTCFLTPISNTSFPGRVQMFPVYVNSAFAVPEDLVHNVYWQGNYLLESCSWFCQTS